jgi:hypothetical protein
MIESVTAREIRLTNGVVIAVQHQIGQKSISSQSRSAQRPNPEWG